VWGWEACIGEENRSGNSRHNRAREYWANEQFRPIAHDYKPSTDDLGCLRFNTARPVDQLLKLTPVSSVSECCLTGRFAYTIGHVAGVAEV
jgi:hypothetical protein